MTDRNNIRMRQPAKRQWRDLDWHEKVDFIIVTVLASFFSLVAAMALAGVLFFGATHQLFMLAICTVGASALWVRATRVWRGDDD